MKRNRFSEEQIIAVLKEQEAGMATADVCRRHGVSSATFCKWKSKYGGLEVSDARQRHAEGNQRKKVLAPGAKRHRATSEQPEASRVFRRLFGLTQAAISRVSRAA